MSDFSLRQALTKCHGTLERVRHELWELGWPETEDDVLWEVRQNTALAHEVLIAPDETLAALKEAFRELSMLEPYGYSFDCLDRISLILAKAEGR